MKQQKDKPAKQLRLSPEVYALLKQEKAETRRPIEAIGNDWLMMAAKMKRLVPKDEEKAA